MNVLAPHPDQRRTRLSLAGQAVEDLSFRPLRSAHFQARLQGGTGLTADAHCKDGGYFAFAGLPAGNYVLRLKGGGLETRRLQVQVPEEEASSGQDGVKAEDLLISLPFENEQVVRLTEDGQDGQERVAVEPIMVRSRIPQGAEVLAEDFSSRLSAPLEPGSRRFLHLESAQGLQAGALLRLVRSNALRLRFTPYAELPFKALRIVGQVTVQGPQPRPTISQATVSVVSWDGEGVAPDESTGAEVFLAGQGQEAPVLGSRRDIGTRTDGQGRYHLYFDVQKAPRQIEVRARHPSFEDAMLSLQVAHREQRVQADFQLPRSRQ